MIFEFDPLKSAANENKHGVPLCFGEELWDDVVVTLPSPRSGEDRRLSLGLISGEHWSVVWAPRGDARRLISVRQSTEKERAYYDRHRDDC